VGSVLSKSAEELIACFEQLPGDDLTIDYELSVTNIVKQSVSEDFERDLIDILGSDLDEDLRYAAFYCLAILYRYQKAFEKAERHLNSYVETFKDKASYSHLRLLHRLAGGFPLTYDDLRIAYENTLICPEHAGVLHLFADRNPSPSIRVQIQDLMVSSGILRPSKV